MKNLISITAVVFCFFIVGCSDEKAESETSITSSTEILNRSEWPNASDIPTLKEVEQKREKTPEEIAIETRAKERQESLTKTLKDEREKVRSEAMYPIAEGAI